MCAGVRHRVSCTSKCCVFACSVVVERLQPNDKFKIFTMDSAVNTRKHEVAEPLRLHDKWRML